MEQRIRSLDDATALRVLHAFAKPKLRDKRLETELGPGLRQALATTFPATPGFQGATPGDLARQALFLLADDPQNHEPLRALIDGPTPQAFGVLEAAAIVTAVLLVLQTHVVFERDKAGKWRVRIEKRPTREGLLQALVAKLLALNPLRGR